MTELYFFTYYHQYNLSCNTIALRTLTILNVIRYVCFHTFTIRNNIDLKLNSYTCTPIIPYS